MRNLPCSHALFIFSASDMAYHQVSWTKEEIFDEGSPLIFCDFLKPGAEKRLYEESGDMRKMQQVNVNTR